MISLGLFGALALATIWGGYPLAVRALGGLRRKWVGQPPAALPTVSVLLASHDAPEAIRARVDDLLATSYPAELLRVIVALDAARARSTPQQLRDLDPRVSVIVGDAPGGKAASLNAAARVAHTDLLAFADTAQRFERDAIPALVHELENPAIGAVSGMLDLPGAGGSLNLAERYWRYERWLRLWEARLHSSVGVTGAIYAMRRQLWEPLPAGLILDDLFVPMRLVLAGWRIGFTDRARAHDVRRFEARQEYHRKVRTLTGIIQVCAWLPGVMNPFRDRIWTQFVFHKLLRLLTPYFALLMLLGAAWFVVRALLATSLGMSAMAAMIVAAALLALVPRVRRMLAWGVAMQGSIVTATINGVRGRWDVWQ